MNISFELDNQAAIRDVLHLMEQLVSPVTRRVENVSGEFFVDDTCISCAACWKEAPYNFFSHPIHTFAYVGKQPDSELEYKLCEQALKLCPVKAIGRESERR